MKQAFCSLCAALVLMLFGGALSSTLAQNPSPTPDPFVIQLTSSGAPFRSNAGDISANGRFVVFESNGDVATEKSSARNNSDGNREIFLADYAQRRIFQITDTKNVPKSTPSPTPTPSPAPSPTPTPSPTPADPSAIQIEISNNRPMITLAPELNASNRRAYVIVFSSNAPTPGSFNGVDPGTLATDGNQELWIYEVPEVVDVDLTSGADLFQELTGGAFTQITDTPASRPPTPGGVGVAPFVADDNRDATISDNGDIIAFISTADLVTDGNTDRNPELFFCDRTEPAARVFTQGTDTEDTFVGPKLISVFQQNPSLSTDGSMVAFLSSGNLDETNNADGNAEVFVGSFSAGEFSIVRQATRTQLDASNATVNVFGFGRRLSRDGSLLALESLANDPKANSSTNATFLGIFVYNIDSDTFSQVGPRAATGIGDIARFPTFTDYDPLSLAPSTLVFASALNFKTDGTFPPADQDSTGLNPSPSGQIRPAQIFSTQVPVSSTNTFTRLTKNPVLVAGDLFSGIRPLPSATHERLAYSFGGIELGTGNADRSFELFYLLSPPVATESAAVLSFSTGASDVALPAVAPSPAPSPSPGIVGLAAGELGIIRTTVEFVSSDAGPTAGSETTRSPALPTELNGVSVSVNGAAAGLYFVGQTSKQINFVVPPAVPNGVATVVVNSRAGGGTQFRGFLLIVPSQPDIFSSEFGPGGRAVVCNVTNSLVMGCLGEPFSVTSPDETGTSVPTILQVNLTGVRAALTSEVKVTIGTTDITGDAITLVRSNPNMPGFDEIRFRVPETLAGATDVPIVVTVTKTGVAFVSRPADTAPLITFSP